MAAADPGQDISELAAFNVGEARTERIPANGQLSIAALADERFGIDAVGLPGLIVAHVSPAELVDEAL